jgi:hypothetical protein
MISFMWIGGLLRDLKPFLIALFFAIRGLPFGTCEGLFPLWLSLEVFWIWAGFWVQYFRMVLLLSGLAPFLDLGGFSRYFSEEIFRVCGDFLGIGIWRV